MAMTPTKLKKLRKDTGLTQEQFGAKFGLSGRTIRSHENNNGMVPKWLEYAFLYLKLAGKLPEKK